RRAPPPRRHSDPAQPSPRQRLPDGHRAPRPASSPPPQGRQPEVVGDGHDGDQRRLLADVTDYGCAGLPWPGQAPAVTVDDDLARVRLEDAGDDARRGRLARAVLTRERDDLTWAHLQVDALEDAAPSEPLGDFPQAEQ